MRGTEHLQPVRETASPAAAREPSFGSILFAGAPPDLAGASEPAFFRDLNLDQVVAVLVNGRDEYDLAPFFHVPLRSVEEVGYRHEVFRDLGDDAVLGALTTFGGRMHRVRTFLHLAQEQRYTQERQRWFLDAASGYVEAVSDLTQTLGAADLDSRGLVSLRDYLSAYTQTGTFDSLRSDADAARSALDGVRYTIRIMGGRVTVAAYDDEVDYGAEIAALFERFRQGDVESRLIKVPDPGSMDHVEAQIVRLVARLFPREFATLDRFCRAHTGFVDETVARFDREVQFYLAVVEKTERLSASGLPLSLPAVSDRSKAETVEDGFDLALALVEHGRQRHVVLNSFDLSGPERMLVVTGPNQGGKTTFARMFGQIHHLAALGLPVPARRAQLALCDRVFTHFERAEVVGSLRGKLDDELVRIRDILEVATSDSVVVLNEMFASAALADALDMGIDVLGQLIGRGCLGVCVTFIDDLSRLSEATVSMVAQVAPGDPAIRTFEILKRPADGRAYAWALARKYGLPYDRLRNGLGE